MTAPVLTPKVDAAQVAADVTKYGTLAIGVLEVVENTLPNLSVPAGAQAIIAAIVGVLTSLLALSKGKAVATAKAAK